jgi:hypothetical protein
MGRQLQDAGDDIQRGLVADGTVPPDDPAGLMRSTRDAPTGGAASGADDCNDALDAPAPRAPDEGAAR